MSRYSKQIKLPQVGDEGQKKLQQASVLVIGAGGLGCAVLPYFVSAGIGKIGIIDGDRIEESNLPRQVLYTESTLGNEKVQEAAKRLSEMNSSVNIYLHREFLSPKNALKIISEYSLIVDATDSIAIRYLINDACVLLKKPFVYASVFKFEGQVSVFNFKGGPTYRCLFGHKTQKVSSCEETGVMGTTVGIIGMLQANEVLKIILGTGEVLSGKLLLYDTLTNRQHSFQFKKDKTLKIDVEFFQKEYTSKKSLATAQETISKGKILLDVREFHEQPKLKLPGVVCIPLSALEQNTSQLNKNDEIRVFCQRGSRSLKALEILKNKGFLRSKSVEGGVKSLLKNKLHESEKRIY